MTTVTKKYAGIVCLLGVCAPVHNVSLVYNIKIAEATQRVTLSHTVIGAGDHARATITLIDQIRETYNHIEQNNAAGLATLFYSRDNWYTRLEMALGHVRNDYPSNVPFVRSRTQLDDFLFSGGYVFDNQQDAKMTIAGLFGIPAHKDVGLLGAQFGTGHVGLGTQLDASYAYSADSNHILFGAARYIRFLPITSVACPDQPFNMFDLAVGNLIDFLFSMRHSWEQHQWEVGYNPTFAFGGIIKTRITQIPISLLFIRGSFYTTYAYPFAIRDHQSGILVGFSYGSDYKPRDFGYKRMYAAWFTWSMNF